MERLSYYPLIPNAFITGIAFVLLLLTATTSAQAAGDSKYDFYGFVQLDAIYDFDRMDPAWKDSLRPSKIPVNCPGDPGCGSDGETIFSVRQTRFGVAASIPTELGELKTKLEFELFGVGSDEGKTTPRLRHAYGELGNFLAGQTWSTFMDIDVFPNSIEYWGPPSMIFWRNMQVRWTPWRNEQSHFSIALESPSSAVDDGKLNGVSPLLSVSGKEKYPDVTAHWRRHAEWGHVQLGGILRVIGYENTASANGEPSGTETGYGINLSGNYKVGNNGTIKAQLAWGKGIASYFNDGGIDLAPDANAQPEVLPILGWLLFYDHSWSEKWSSSIGWAMAEQDNSAGQINTAFKSSQYGLVNLLHYPAKNVMFGGELQYGEFEQNDGLTASDTRMQFSAKYSF